MNFMDIQKLINDSDYWDSRVKSIDCNYFADEVYITYNNGIKTVSYKFVSCYRINFEHIKSYDKLIPVKNMTDSQIPYFLIDIKIGEAHEKENNFLTCNINMFPLNIEIWCKDIVVEYQ